MKQQFLSTESLRIRLTPFIDKVSGSYVVSGLDTVTLTIERPDGAVHTGGTVSAVFDSVAKLWTFDISTGSFMQGEWRVFAQSNAANTLPKWAVLQWGDYVDSIQTTATTANTVNSKLGTPAGASIAADIATVNGAVSSVNTAVSGVNTAVSGVNTAVGNVNTAVGNVNTKLGTPAGASVSADIASIKVDTTALFKIGTGRWKVQGTQLIFYEQDDVTPFLVFNLLDDADLPSGIRVFQRVPTS